MLLSMTGFGSGTAGVGAVQATAEVRTVNHRGLKISSRLTPSDAATETQVEKLVRERLRRGSVQVAVKATAIASAGGASNGAAGDVSAASTLDVSQVLHYFDMAAVAADQAGVAKPDRIEPFLTLPGATLSAEATLDGESLQAAAIAAVEAALASLHEFRKTEGEALQADLSEQVAAIRGGLSAVAARAPEVAAAARDRLKGRLEAALEGTGVQPTEEQIVREVAVFVDRADVNEEITRLASHLDQFDAMTAGDVVEGRKLDFLCQEMFREINTIGSKANDLSLSQTVVEMKAAAEKLREQVQNVE